MDASNFIPEIVKYFPTTLESNVSINFIVNVTQFISYLEKALFDVLEGVSVKKSGQSPRPPFFARSSRVSIPLFDGWRLPWLQGHAIQRCLQSQDVEIFNVWSVKEHLTAI